MKIGLDFDNTIVNYDQVFYTVAIEWDAIPRETAANKLAVRDFLRKSGKEELWTLMQGYVYGTRMSEVKPYPGFLEFIRSASEAGHTLVIISHKTTILFLDLPTTFTGRHANGSRIMFTSIQTTSFLKSPKRKNWSALPSKNATFSSTIFPKSSIRPSSRKMSPPFCLIPMPPIPPIPDALSLPGEKSNRNWEFHDNRVPNFRAFVPGAYSS